jgi:hypothetical protein
MNNNNNRKGKRSKKPSKAAHESHAVKELLNDIRQAAGQPAKGKGRGRRNRQAKKGESLGVNMSGGSTTERKVMKFSEQMLNYINGNTGIGVTAISVNPGDPTVFPRLSQMAKLFVYWRFKSLTIKWVPNGSAFAAANQVGEVVVAYTNGWYDTPPTTVPVARARAPNVVCEAWVEKALHVPSEELNKVRYVRDNPSASAADARLYDSLINVTVAGTPLTGGLGYLILDGEIELWEDYTPVALATLAPLQNRLSSWYNTNAQVLTTAVQALLGGPGTITCLTAYLGGPVITISATIAGAIPTGTYSIKTTVYVTTTTSLASIQLDNTVTGALQSTTGTIQKNSVAGTTYSYTRDDWIVVAEGALANFAPSITVVGVGTITMQSWSVQIVTHG